jgi:hypothetical protein
MRVLVCGSRDYSATKPIEIYLTGLKVEYGDDLVVIEGGAKGADSIAADWCKRNGFVKGENWLQFPITEEDWGKRGKAAGVIRNKQMLDEGKPDLVLAFKDDFDWFLGSGGTENMVLQATKANVPAYVMRKNTYVKGEYDYEGKKVRVENHD